MNRIKFILPLILMACCMACAVSSSFGDMEKQLPKELGYMLYSEAVDQWGQPTYTGTEGKFTTATWERKGIIVTERLKLSFDDRQIMRAYDYNQKPFD